MTEDDLFVDDVLENLHKKEKKKIDSKDKGQRGERDLCAVFSKRFPSQKGFFRVVGSGNRWAQVDLTEQAKRVLTSDVVCPEGFQFSIECKYGYASIDLSTCLEKGHKELDGFLNQAEKDAEKVGKKPMLCWRKPYQPWLTFIKQEHAPKAFPYQITYRDWVGVSLQELFTIPDSYFFS